MYRGNIWIIRTKEKDIDAAGKATKVSNLTSLPSFLQAHHPYIAHLYHCTSFFRNTCGFFFFFVMKLYPCNYLSRECGLYKASDLLLGDHVCEKSDAVKLIDCP